MYTCHNRNPSGKAVCILLILYSVNPVTTGTRLRCISSLHWLIVTILGRVLVLPHCRRCLSRYVYLHESHLHCDDFIQSRSQKDPTGKLSTVSRACIKTRIFYVQLGCATAGGSSDLCFSCRSCQSTYCRLLIPPHGRRIRGVGACSKRSPQKPTAT